MENDAVDKVVDEIEEKKTDTTNEIKFEELDPEIQKYIDRERLRASTTAREKAKRDALNDPDIRAAIKSELEAEATLTAEQKVERKMKEALTIENRALAREKLVNGGFVGEELEEVLGLVVSEDAEATISKVDKLLNVVKKAVESENERRTRESLRKTPKPVVSPTETKEFKDMNFEERMKLKDADPQRYKLEMEKLRTKI